MTRCSRCYRREGSSSCCACRILWDSTRKGWMAESTIRRLVGREEACGLPTALELLFTQKVVKERLARSYISSCALTLSHTRHVTRDKRIPSGAKFRVEIVHRVGENNLICLPAGKSYGQMAMPRMPSSSGTRPLKSSLGLLMRRPRRACKTVMAVKARLIAVPRKYRTIHCFSMCMWTREPIVVSEFTFHIIRARDQSRREHS